MYSFIYQILYLHEYILIIAGNLNILGHQHRKRMHFTNQLPKILYIFLFFRQRLISYTFVLIHIYIYKLFIIFKVSESNNNFHSKLYDFTTYTYMLIFNRKPKYSWQVAPCTRACTNVRTH